MAPEDDILRRIRQETPARGLPPISIGPDEGSILQALVLACGARKAVEVGTLAGYSACWIARGLPEEGVLHTLEYEAKHAAVARENIRRAGLSSRVILHEGSAVELLPGLAPSGPFDFCFIDADKINYPSYLHWAIDHLRPGGIVAADNAYLFGKVHLKGAAAGQDAPAAEAMRQVLKTMADRRFFSACSMIPTGEGLAVAVRK
jgi:caffeoyl-CoA O-methyltransferase